MALTAEQFGKALVASGLATAEELKASWNSLPADGRPKDAAGFARALIDLGRLTPFQAQELLAGRGERLQMGEYLLLAEIGAGGMGKVYKAQHRRMKRIVALKVMSSAAMQDDAAVKRFQREVEAAARLEHPNIVTAYDSGEVGKVKYLVMQFVDGGDLSDFVKKNGPLPIEAAVDYVLQAARGLAFAHAAGVVHRDIKPANLLLDKKGVVKILDMGLARIEDGDGLTATEQVMGTVDYMSPEQAAETKNADARSDIYSLGCTLWYLLSAKKLFDGDTMISRLMKHRDAEPPSLVKTRDDASWPLEQAFHKMIAKRPQDRYQSMEEVIAALEPFGPSGSPSSGGMGSSIGGGKGQSAELASFMQAMAGGKSTGSSASLQTKSTTSPAVDATAAFSSAEIGTDPKSALHSRGASPLAGAKPQSGVRKKKPPVKLLAGGLGAFALLACFGIWVVVRDKEGRVVAEVAVPAGGDVSVRQTTQIDVAPIVAPNFATTGATTPAVGSPISTKTTSSAAKNTPAPAAERWPYDPPDGQDYVWSAPENLGRGVNSADNERPAGVADDDLAIYFLRRNSILMVARRTRADLPFADARPVPGITVTGGDACVSADELALAVMQSPDGRKREVWWSERRSPADQFPELRPLTSDGRPSGAHAMLSPDGLTLLTTTGDVNLWTRSAPGAPFTGPQRLPEPINTSQWDMPGSITADQRLLIVMNQTGSGPRATRRVVYHTRADRNLPFDAARPLDVPLGPAADLDTTGGFRLSGDGRSVYFSSFHYPGGAGNEDIWVSRRVPKVPSSPTTATPTTSLAVADLLESPDYVWSEPENLGPGVNSSVPELKPTLSADELRLIFRCDEGVSSSASSLWECRRATTDEPFGPRVRLTGSAYEDEPFLSADGLTLLYDTHAVAKDRVAKDIRIRRRSALDAPWSPPETVVLPDDYDEQTPWLSPDARTLIYSSARPGGSGSRDLWICNRAAPDAPFGPPTNFRCGANSPAPEQSPQPLSDGRTVLFARDGKPQLTFTSPTGVLSALPVRGVADDVREPWLSADGRRMYFQSDRPGGRGAADLWMSRRVPKGSPPAGAAPGPRNSPPLGKSSIAAMLDSPDYVWTEPEPLGPEVNLGGVNTSPVVSSDGLELWFASYGGTQAKVPGQGDEDLWVARRKSLAAPWEPAVNVGPPINDVGKDVNPALSADGLRLVFWRYPEYTLYESKRAATAAPWSEPVKLSAQLGANINHPWLSADGLELLFSTVPGGKLRRSTRPDRDAEWGTPTDLPQLAGTLEAAALWVSPDGRDMLGHWLKSRSPNVYEYWLAERSTPADPWSAPRRIELPNNMQAMARPFPVLTPTGLELYFVH
ncbi:MAG: serine/threonine-protein kinase, partial [Planctomycetaceae bacterium]|nr:serine/threonine-protein kinase [Planctomycetaceae bacterium]